MTVQNHEQRLLEINTLEWDDLLAPGDSNMIISTQQGICMMLLLLVRVRVSYRLVYYLHS